MPHHYDEHDHDKLIRWRNDRSAAADGDGNGEFPALALFLVKPQSTGAHEIFRRFRTEFEGREAGFADLVIFGMHGVSATVRSLLRQTGLTETDLPVMLLAPAADPAAITAVQLPSGESLEGGDDPNGDGTCDYLAPWQDALDRIRITRRGRPLRLRGVQGRQLDGPDLRTLPAVAVESVAVG